MTTSSAGRRIDLNTLIGVVFFRNQQRPRCFACSSTTSRAGAASRLVAIGSPTRWRSGTTGACSISPVATTSPRCAMATG